MKKTLPYHCRLAFPSSKLFKRHRSEDRRNISLRFLTSSWYSWWFGGGWQMGFSGTESFPSSIPATLDCSLTFVELFLLKISVGSPVWSLLIHFLLPITFRCFQLLLLVSHLKPTYNMSLFFNTENYSQGFSRSSSGWTELCTFLIPKIHLASEWFLHFISAQYSSYGKLITLTSGSRIHSYAHPWHTLELQARETKELSAALRGYDTSHLKYCVLLLLWQVAPETCFFKHWWWWWWHRADYKGPLGRKLLPERSRALPAVSLSGAEVYYRQRDHAVVSHFLQTLKHRTKNFVSRSRISFFRLFNLVYCQCLAGFFILLLYPECRCMSPSSDSPTGWWKSIEVQDTTE